MNKFEGIMKRLYIIFAITGLLLAQDSVVRQFSEALADVAEKAKPAVVTIITNKKISMNWTGDNDMFFFFFPDQRNGMTAPRSCTGMAVTSPLRWPP